MGYIYKIINDVNDKIYIGQTINTIEYRFKCHINEANQTIHQSKFHLALSKIGAEHFKIELIEECPNEELNDREEYWIKFYDSVNQGYNTTWGGSYGLHYNRDEILELWAQGLNIQKISNKLGIDRGLLGQILKQLNITEKEIDARRYIASQTQIKNRSVYQIDIKTGKIIKQWDKISDAERQLNISHSIIINCCNLKPQAKTAGGFAWRYTENYNEDNDKNKLIQQVKHIPHNSKTILLYDKNNVLIGEYINSTDAAEQTGRSANSISKYCRGERKDPKGFIWKYKN